MSWEILDGDCLERLADLDDDSIDAVVTDPPYGLSAEPDAAEVLRHWLDGDDYQHRGGGFMGKTWDSFVPGPTVWKECLRVLKPGGHLVAFFGTRTVDLGGMAIRLAGFEIRDCLAWHYGSGFPKSLDVSKAIDKAAGAEREVVGVRENINVYQGRHAFGDSQVGEEYGKSTITAPATDLARQWQGWGTALKPAFEPIILARKPLIGTVAENVTRFGTGALNVDGCRVGTDGGTRKAEPAKRGSVNAYGDGLNGGGVMPIGDGRWPANLVLDDQAAAMLDEQSGETVSRFFASFDSSTMDQCPQPGERSTKDANTSAGRRAEKNAVDSPTDGSGNKNTDRSRPATTSTTETTTRSTTTSKTSNSSSADDTNDITVNSEPPKSSETESADARSVENGNLSSTSTQGQPDHDRQSAENVVAHTSENGESETGSGTTPICANTANGTQPQTRFFYQAKASRAERNAGLTATEADRPVFADDGGTYQGLSNSKHSQSNAHPTVKPIDLMRWLVRLVTPPGGTVLDPFTGSGTTGIAAGLEGFEFVGIEREAEYREIAEARLRWWVQQEGETAEILHRAGLAEKQREKHKAVGQTSLFEVEAA